MGGELVRTEGQEIAAIDNEFARPVAIQGGGNLAVSAAREAQAVLGMIMAAKRFPRENSRL